MFFDENAVLVGLTGMSGAGKTSACAVFREHGFAVVNCDLAARAVTEPGKPALREIAGRFGGEYLQEDGSLNRRGLGSLVFSDKAARLALNEIIYPYISYEMIVRVISYINRGERFLLLDAPTLFESGTDALCDAVVSLTADREVCRSRIMKRDGLTWEQAEDRLSSQFPKEFYRSRSAFCIENNSSEEELKRKVSAAAEALKERVGGLR